MVLCTIRDSSASTIAWKAKSEIPYIVWNMSVDANPIDVELLLTRLKRVAPWSDMEDGVKFDNRYYLITHLDVLTHGADPYQHYLSHGKSEGRKWKAWSGEIEREVTGASSEESSSFGPSGHQSLVFNRQTFAQLVLRSKQILEIGPFTSPLCRGENVSYADILDTAQLRVRAEQLGLEKSGIPEIDFVVTANDLSTIQINFDAVISSHVIEHQPDLIGHLIQVSNLLREGGRYFLLIPDHRYCFDHFQDESSTIELVSAHQERRSRHTTTSLIKHRSATTHNNAVEHWAGSHGFTVGISQEILAQSENYWNDKNAYIDCHAWYFTPDSWLAVINELKSLDLVSFEVEYMQATQLNDIEFYSVLRKTK